MANNKRLTDIELQYAALGSDDLWRNIGTTPILFGMIIAYRH